MRARTMRSALAAAISSGTLDWGFGYTNPGLPGTTNDKLYAFGLP